MGGQKQGANKKKNFRGLFASKNIIPKSIEFSKFMNKEVFVVIIIIGVVLMLMSGGGKKTDDGYKSGGSEEKRLSEILEKIDGVGKVSVMITYNRDSKSNENVQAKGVIITAEGAENVGVQNSISEAAGAALNLPAHKVRVYKMKSRE